MTSRLLTSVIIYVCSTIILIDGQFGGSPFGIGPAEFISPFDLPAQFGGVPIPFGPPQEVSPFEAINAARNMPSVAGQRFPPGMQRLNAGPFPFPPRNVIDRPPFPMPFSANQVLLSRMPQRFNRNRARNRNLVQGLPFSGNSLRVMPNMVANSIRSFEQRRLQQEANRRAQITQRFRNFVRTTPGSSINRFQQPTVRPNLPEQFVDLSRFPNFGTQNGNEQGRRLINQLGSFQQIAIGNPGQRTAPLSAVQASMQTEQESRLPQRARSFAMNNAAVPNLQNNALSPTPVIQIENNMQGGNNLPDPIPAPGMFPSQWSLPSQMVASNAIAGQNTGQTLESQTQTDIGATTQALAVDPSQLPTPDSTVSLQQPQSNTGNEKPVEYVEQITIFHSQKNKLCFKGMGLSTELSDWVVRILNAKMNDTDGLNLCDREKSFTIPELVEFEKELYRKGIDPHSISALGNQQGTINPGSQDLFTGTVMGPPAGSLTNTRIPLPPAEALVAQRQGTNPAST